MHHALKHVCRLLLSLTCAVGLQGAGTLTPVDSAQAPIQILDHHVEVVITNGFSRVEVEQTFHNPNDRDLEAIYACPVPRGASLSEMEIVSGESRLRGEVLPRAEAKTIYEEEKAAGNDTGLAEKNGYQTFEFRVFPVKAKAETRVRFLYYQPLEIDTGIARFLYPLEDGGTDELAKSFWTPNTRVEGTFSARIQVRSGWPVADIRVPGHEQEAQVLREAEGCYTITLNKTGASLDRDLLLYYRLMDNLPGRVELLTHRPDAEGQGTFMMVVTPGADLKPLNQGADYAFVLDVSGSMQGKLGTLANGVSKTLLSMRPNDRFRIVIFSNQARELIPWTEGSPEKIKAALEAVGALQPQSGTNLYEGLALGLKDLDADRASSVVLVTDGVANEGLVDPKDFLKLLKERDVRVFGFLMGNSANWPLMELITGASGGFYAPVSNEDDILGQLLLAKSKIQFECMHDAALEIKGVKVTDLTGAQPRKIYRGQQWVMFGRYQQGGTASITLKTRQTGQDRTYTTAFNFPVTDAANPELERLWALAKIEDIERLERVGLTPADEARDAIRDLGVQYQLVTDHTAMLVLRDEAFAARGIDRRNLRRTEIENLARVQQAANTVPASNRADTNQPMFTHPTPSAGGGGGGGALDPFTVLSGLLLLGLTWGWRR